MERETGDWIEAYLRYTQVSETPQRIHRWVAIATIAGALRKRVWLPMGHWSWTPNFYIVFVAPPGVLHKSTSVGIGERLLREVPAIHLGPDATSWQALIDTMLEARIDYEIGGVYRPMSAISVFSSELGTFLDPQDRAAVSALIDLWDGRPQFNKITRHYGDSFIVEPWINLVACTTPSWVADNFTSQFLEQGLVARFILVHESTLGPDVAYPALHVDARAQETLRQALVRDLCRIARIGGPYEMTPDAYRYGAAWYTPLRDKMRAACESERALAQLQRKQTHLHKLAMVIAASRSNRRVLDEHMLATADAWLTEFEADSNRALRLCEVPLEARNTDVLAAALVRAGRALTRHELYRCVWESIPRANFEEALEASVSAGRLALGFDGRISLKQ